ncbi:MAG: L,D-transpeptidase family protein, partial [Acidobacteria bacterium]|nr:L,D-transpeptidase family protein [Acidobacteriota bacterium]
MALSGCRRRTPAPTAAALQTVLSQPPIVLAPPPPMPIVLPDENVAPGVPHDAAIWADVQEFYTRREGMPVWLNDRSPAKRATAALEVLRTAPAHGLVTADYGEPDIVARLAALDAGDKNAIDRLDRLAELEVRLTTALFSLGRDVAIGRTSPQRISRTWKPQRTAPDLVGSLALAAEASLTFWLDGLRPQHPEYPALQKALADLRARTPATPSTPADIQRITLNLERWRWMPDDFGARALIVNIPLYRVQIRENEQTTREIRVVVGKRGHETPIFSGVMSTIVFSPYWNIPDSIVAGETAPAVAKDPRYLAKHRIEILRTTADGVQPISPSQVNWDDPKELRQLAFRQKPGPNNALGHVKFLFPNEYDVY